jgi:hypothetical protein
MGGDTPNWGTLLSTEDEAAAAAADEAEAGADAEAERMRLRGKKGKRGASAVTQSAIQETEAMRVRSRREIQE